MTIDELERAANSLGYKLIPLNRSGMKQTHCRLGHEKIVWPCGEYSCRECKREGVRRRRALAAQRASGGE